MIEIQEFVQFIAGFAFIAILIPIVEDIIEILHYLAEYVKTTISVSIANKTNQLKKSNNDVEYNNNLIGFAMPDEDLDNCDVEDDIEDIVKIKHTIGFRG